MNTPGGRVLQDWLAGATGGRVLGWEPLTSGNSRSSFAADLDIGGVPLALVVRHDQGDGPVAGTALSLEREAVVYRALEGSGLPVPQLYASSPALGVIAVGRMAGATQESGAVLPDLLARLAELHALDVNTFELPGFARTAAAELDLWQDIARQKLDMADELVELAFAILRERFPGEPDRLSLCHGDFGEGNFLVEDGLVSALLDWEFSHLGDPHDDLAWITIRALMYGHELPGFDQAVRSLYAPAVPVQMSPERLRYWQAVTLLRNLICCLSAAGAVTQRDRSIYLMLMPGLRYWLVRLLAGLCDVALSPTPDRPEPPARGPGELPGDALLRELASGLAGVAGAIPEAEPRRRARRLARIADQLAENWWLAASVAHANAADRARAQPDRASQLRLLGRITERELWVLPRASPNAGCLLPDGGS